MEWKELKQKVYFEDGALRNVIIHGTDLSHWRLWIDFVNANYEIEYTAEDNTPTNFIDYTDAGKYLIGQSDVSRTATFQIGNCIAKCYFFSVEEIEYDLDPKEVVSINEHLAVIEHLMNVSTLLNSKVILALEGFPQEPLLIVNGQHVDVVSASGF